jgi:hypothetical protein
MEEGRDRDYRWKRVEIETKGRIEQRYSRDRRWKRVEIETKGRIE